MRKKKLKKEKRWCSKKCPARSSHPILTID
jgi:hypothetical protein